MVGNWTYPTPEPDVLFLANWHSSIRVDDYRVFPLSEEGRVVEFADPSEHPVLAAAQRAVWKGGVVTFVDENPTLPKPEAIGGFELIRKFEGHTGPVKSVAFSPDGRLAASGSGWPSGDQTVRIWDVKTGEQFIDRMSATTSCMSPFHLTDARYWRAACRQR